jgi:hypothetical protein
MTYYTLPHWPYILLITLCAYVALYAWVMFAHTPKGRR